MSHQSHVSTINRAKATDVIAYVRVSTEGQEEGMGLAVQRNAIVAYAAANGMTVAEWHQDVESGAKEHRSGLDALRAKVGAGASARFSATGWTGSPATC